MQLDKHGSRISTVCLCILASIAAGAALYQLADVMIPFVLALMLSMTLGPLVDAFVRVTRIPRLLSTFAVLSFCAAAAFGIGTFIAASAKELVADWPQYSDRLQAFIQDSLDRIGIEVERSRIRSWLGTGDADLPRLVTNTINALLGLIRDGAIVLIYLVFLLVGEPSTDPGDTWVAIRNGIRRYVGLKVLISLMTAVTVGGVLAWIGVEYVPLLALLVFLFNFVPNVGPPLATVLPLPLVVASNEIGTVDGVLAIAIPAGIQLTFGEFLEPKILGRQLDLHPVTILLSLIFWGTLWGVIGVFLAVPLTAAIRIVFGELEFMKPIANLMAGRMRLQLSSDEAVE